jgi:hypothetical protein
MVGRRSFGIDSETSPYLCEAGGQWTVDHIDRINKLLHTESVNPAKDQSRSPLVYPPNSHAAQGGQREATEPTCALHLHFQSEHYHTSKNQLLGSKRKNW